MNKRRVAITGIGLMSALGTTREVVWNGLVEGRCGIARLTLFDPSGYRSQQVAEIPHYLPDPAFSEKEWRRLSRSDQMAIIASREALGDSGVLDTDPHCSRIGVVLGAGTADLFRSEWRRLSRSDQMAIIASREALGDSGVLDTNPHCSRIGVVLGSGTADLL